MYRPSFGPVGLWLLKVSCSCCEHSLGYQKEGPIGGQLYNFIFTHQKCPAGWTKDIAYPLYKQGTKRDPTNYRLITLMSVMAKVFERIMHTRLTAWTHDTRDPVIDPTQVGFQANRCTLDHLY